jgi:glyoxylase-like metal-dependent hydrolase (beta-lactamase superfamily II)
MKQDVIKFDSEIYQIDVFMENKSGRMSCYYIDSSNPILVEVGPSNSFPYLISSLESLGISEVKRSAMTHLHLDHIGGIGHLVEKYKEHFVYIHELGIKHLPNPEKLWKAVSDIYTEEWLSTNWGEIKPTPIKNIHSLQDKELIDLGNGRKLEAIYGPGHAKHHYTFYDEYSKTLFMGDTLGLIYPHGDFVQPNLPPPDFNKEVLFNTLDDLKKLDLKYLALAHFGMHGNPYKLIENAKTNIEEWLIFSNNLNDMSDKTATESIRSWVRGNYEFLNIDENTINNYIQNANFQMQIQGMRNYLANKKNP